MGAKESFYSSEDWEEKGDAFRVSPHLDSMYRCQGCGDHVQVAGIMEPDEVIHDRHSSIVNVVGVCLTCAQPYLVLVDRRHLGRGGS